MRGQDPDSPSYKKGSFLLSAWRNRKNKPDAWFWFGLCGWVFSLFFSVLYIADSTQNSRGTFLSTISATLSSQPSYESAPVLISYSYFEKDAIQQANFEFFLAAGMQPHATSGEKHWVFVISGDACTPCKPLHDQSKFDMTDYRDMGIKTVHKAERFTLLARTENIGMDVAAHNITLEYLKAVGTYSRYKYFILLNSSIKGPFYPSYMPLTWHWTFAFLERFEGNIHGVSSSLVCLPEVDAGGPGPKMESWALAFDVEGLEAVGEQGALWVRSCKLCVDAAEGIVVGGEYGITTGLFKKGYNIATLMSRYARGTDWQDPKHWGCNDNAHPSRHGTYAGIAFHPYETIFVKSSWHVADPYTSRYAAWELQHLKGQAGTDGQFNEPVYRYGISAIAQESTNLDEAYRPKLAFPPPAKQAATPAA